MKYFRSEKMIYSVGHVVSIAVMDCAGMCVNVWFLYTIKTRVHQLNAIDFLQVYKTVLCLAALLLCVWIEVVVCSSKVCVGLKAIADDFCYYSTCLAFLAIAYVRYRASECRGHASVLVTHRFAIKTILICLSPIGMFTPAVLSLMTNVRSSDDTLVVNSTQTEDIQLLHDGPRIAYEICHLAVFIIIPIFTSGVLYYNICKLVNQAARTMEGSVSSRKNDPSKLITLSVTILLSMMLSVWGIYTVVRVISLFVKVDELFFIYWKLVVLIVHPFGEGILQKSGKKSTNRNSLQDRSKRQVYPIDSVAITSRVLEDSFETMSVADKLPALIEECETQGKFSNTSSDVEASIAEEHTHQKPFKAMRKTSSHPRTSVLIRNAAVIGLEYQGQRSNVGINKQRKVSQECLRSELLNIEKAALNRLRTRRLSNCLRFSTANESSDDEIFHMYRELYDRKGSKFSEKSRKTSSAKSNIPEFKALSYVNYCDTKDGTVSESGSGTESPSQRRWRRLYTTAKTARKFSDLRKERSQPVIEEELTGEKQSIEKDIGICIRHDTASEIGTKPSAVFLASKHRSFDSQLGQNLESKANFVGGKKRSISCVSNAWIKNKKHSTDRKKSVSFIQSVVLDAPSTSAPGSSPQRSFSYDSEIQLSYMKKNENQNTKVRLSCGNTRDRNDTKDDAKFEHWLLDKRTTRKECIEKLMEMKEYF